MSGLFDYPRQSAVMRTVPKTKIYEHAKPSHSLRERFVKEIDKIVWLYKLAPETINLPSKPAVPEIQIFGIWQKQEKISEDLLLAIDRSIHFPIFFHQEYADSIRVSAAYKRPSESESGGWVVESYFHGPWQSKSVAHEPLPLALDLERLYEQMLRTLMPFPSRAGESLKAQSDRMVQIQSKQKELDKLEALMHREKQFNRKVEYNAQVRELKNELDALNAN